MDAKARQQRREALERKLRSQGRPLTVQRRLILEALFALDDHPTADRVHRAVARRHPGISRPTVYRTLETLVRLGLLARVVHAGKGLRYDCRVDTHHHLVCVRCDAVLDFDGAALPALPVPDTSAHGFEVSEVSVQLRGTCRRCRGKEAQP